MTNCRYRIENLCRFDKYCSDKARFSTGVSMSVDGTKYTIYGVCEEEDEAMR